MSNRLQANYDRLAALRADLRAKRDALVDKAERQGRRDLTEPETRSFNQLSDQITDIEARCGEASAELRRGNGDDEAQKVRRATAGVTRDRGRPHPADDGPYGSAPPIHFDLAQLKHAHESLRMGMNAQIETRAFISGVDEMIPPTLFPQVVGQIHENRLLDRIPAQAIDAPSIEFIRHISSTGSAGVTAEGAVKPEVVMNFDQLTATLVKLAGHTAIPMETIDDFNGFVSYVGVELTRQVIDQENLAFLSGPGGSGQVEGLLNTSGVLTHVAGAGTTGFTPLDDIEIAIAQLRTGPALANPDLLVLHPDTWSALRRTKDSLGRYLLEAEPTADLANSVWGIDVLQTTQIAAGTGVLIDTQKFGRAVIRGPIIVFMGWMNDDFVRNLRRFVSEERVAMACTRPAAVNIITELPTSP